MTAAGAAGGKGVSELKPCPFCGGKAKGLDGDPGSGYDVSCSTHDCPASHDTAHETPEAAIAAWNDRAEGWIPVETYAELVRHLPGVVATFDGHGNPVDFAWRRAVGYIRKRADSGCRIGAVTMVYAVPLPEPPEAK